MYCLLLFKLIFSVPVKIVAANWGGKDVTKKVAQLHKKKDGIFTATTKELGDPLPNKRKFLHVIYTVGGVVVCFKIKKKYNYYYNYELFIYYFIFFRGHMC